MSTIKTGTTLTTAYQVVGDTTGALVIQTGATPTTAATFDTSQNTTVAGNLTLSGTGKRITGDFSNATIANRVAFQTSTTNAGTTITAIPNGTGTGSQLNLESDASQANGVSFQILANTGVGENRLQSGIRGTGSYLPMTFYTGGLERVRIDTSGNLLVGGTTTTSKPASSVVAPGGFTAINNGAAEPTIQFFNSNAGTDLKYWRIQGNPSGGLSFQTVNDAYSSASQKVIIDTSGNVLVTGGGGLGYGTGSGGTVTQATSKSTAVTLNKPTGQITMNNAALAAGASVAFLCSNSLVSSSDSIIATLGSFGDRYRIEPYAPSVGGGISFRLTNITGTSQSDAVVFNFAIIKGATA